MEINDLKNSLAHYQIDDSFIDDQMGLCCCRLALESLENGCYGVGAVLYDTSTKLVIEAHNEVFLEGFHSGRHAEMVALNRFEDEHSDYGDRSNLTMIVSLEPCPMCFTRLLLAGIGQIKYLVADDSGGMVTRLVQMPPVWQNLAQIQQHQRASVSPTLSTLAAELAACQLQQLRTKLMMRIRGKDV